MEVEIEKKEEKEEGEKTSPQLVLLSARGFQKNTQSSLHYAHVRAHTHTNWPVFPHKHTYKHTNTRRWDQEVLCANLLCPWSPLRRLTDRHPAMPALALVPLTHTQTQTHTLLLLTHCGCRHCSIRILCVRVCICVFASTFLLFHRPQETNAKELGACERHHSHFHTWRMEHRSLEISV